MFEHHAKSGNYSEIEKVKGKVWDLRRQSSLATVDTGQPAVSLDIHPTAPLFSVSSGGGGGGPQHNLSVWGLDGKMINMVRPGHSRPSTATASLNNIKCHPTLIRLAAAGSDLSLGVWGYRKY